MALPDFAVHSLTVYPRVETADPVTKIVPVPTEGAGETISCSVQPIRHEVVVDSRTGVELMNPYRVFVLPADIGKVPYGARAVWNDTGEQFRITKRPMRELGMGVLADMSHGIAEMELLEKAG